MATTSAAGTAPGDGRFAGLAVEEVVILACEAARAALYAATFPAMPCRFVVEEETSVVASYGDGGQSRSRRGHQMLTPTGKNQSIWVYGRSVCEHCLHYCVELPPCDAL